MQSGPEPVRREPSAVGNTVFGENWGGEAPPRWGPGTALALWAFALFFSTLWLAVLIGLTGQEGDDFGSTPIWLLVGQLGLWVPYSLGPLVLARSAGHRRSFFELFGLDFEPLDVLLWGPIGVLTQILLVPLVYLPISWFINTDDVSAAAEDLVDRAATIPDVGLLFLAIVVVAPVVEELFFRGFALPGLMKVFGPWTAIVISSVWFAASHFQLIQFPGLLAIGLVLAYARVRTGRLLPCIALHMAFNAVTFGILVSRMNLA